MVMSVLVDKEGKVCVAHDTRFDGNPVSLHYAPISRALTVHLDNGTQEHLGLATMPEIIRQLHHAKWVKLLELRRPDPAQQYEVPLHIQMTE